MRSGDLQHVENPGGIVIESLVTAPVDARRSATTEGSKWFMV